MKYVLAILLGFSCVDVSAQTGKEMSDAVVNNAAALSLSAPGSNDIGYELAPVSKSVLNCKVSQVFFCNTSSIFYSSQIILIDSTRFFWFFKGCLARYYSAGYYELNDDTLKLTQNKRVTRKIKGYISKEIKNGLKREIPDNMLLQFNGNKLRWVL